MKRSELKRKAPNSMKRGHPDGALCPPPLTVCYFAAVGYMDHPQAVMPPCDGRLVKCHLIPRVVLESHHLSWRDQWDARVWRWSCGGVRGIGGHHGMLDFSRTLRLPRLAIPQETEEFAEQFGLTYWLDREYGPLGSGRWRRD